jgi:hypothetical protein
MTDAERLRTRVMIAAQKFAAELADAVLEATGKTDEEKAAEEKPSRKRKTLREPPPPPTFIDPLAAKRAESALASIGIRKL